MKLKFVCIFLSLFATAFAEELTSSLPTNEPIKQQFGYVSAGLGPMPIPLPVFAGGYRSQLGNQGLDVSLQVSTVVTATQVKTNVLYLRYPKPSLSSEFYVGAGIAPGCLFGSDIALFTLSPEFVFGKQYRNESNDLRFFQLQASFPTFSIAGAKPHNPVFLFPLITISYGIGF